jgi:Ca2+/Na+ antiporter
MDDKTIGLIGGIAGTLIGITGGVLGVYFSLKSAKTDEERRFLVLHTAVSIPVFFILLGIVLWLRFTLPRTVSWIPLLAMWVPLLPYLIWFNSRWASLRNHPARLEELIRLREQGLITEAEFQEKRKQIVDQL